jgi:hypothetical protein
MGKEGERTSPHEEYGVQKVPKSRAEALGELEEEIRREMARRAGSYGQRLLELFEGIEDAQIAFEEGLAALRDKAKGRFGPAVLGWPWPELLARIEELPEESKAPLAEDVRAVEHWAQRYEGLRTEAALVRHHLIVHREAMGFRRHHLVEEKFPAPKALPSLEKAWRQICTC